MSYLTFVLYFVQEYTQNIPTLSGRAVTLILTPFQRPTLDRTLAERFITEYHFRSDEATHWVIV
jgi:hypothetical protein